MLGTFRAGGPLKLACDVAIVGSGAGGACVADVLLKAGLDVVMLEEGPYIPAQEATATATQSMPAAWRCGGLTAAFGRTPIAYAEGRCVGGGTEINSAIFQQTPDDLIEQWADRYQIAEFTPALLQPFFDRAAAAVNASFTSGPLGRAADILKAGGDALGWKVDALKRGQRSCVGTNLCAFVCPTGGKQSMSNSLLPQAVSRGLRLISECRVTRLAGRAGRIEELRALARDGQGRTFPVTVRAKAFFLAAGAVHTPALLQRSGMRGRIGSSLRLHPTIKTIALFDDVVDAHRSRLPLYAVTEFMPAQRIGGSVFSPALFAMAVAEDLAHREDLLEKWRQCGLYYGMIRPEGTGRVTAIPGVAEPFVQYNLLPRDWSALSSILARLTKLLFAAGAKSVIPSVSGQRSWHSLKEAHRDLSAGLSPRKSNLMSIHIFSSCPPGEAPNVTVTDSFGRLRSFSNLVVSDASQIPEAPGVNPQGTVMALAYRAAEAWLARSQAEHRREALGEQ